MSNPIITIITSASLGLQTDATLYKKIFENNNFVVKIESDSKMIDNKSSFLLSLEHIVVKDNIVNIFMPNHELFKSESQFDKLKDVDIVLTKTNISYEFFKSIRHQHGLKYKLYYTNFSTYIPLAHQIDDKDIVKDVNLFSHFAGSSLFKNTAYVIKNWLLNNCYLQYDPDIKLVITCRALCYKNLHYNMKKYLNFDLSKYKSEKHGYYKYKNLTMYSTKLDDKYFEILQKTNVALCPSAKEGFGHYINEARYYDTFVVTIDHPPMNELVNDINGYLIKDFEKLDQHIAFSKYKLYSVYPTDDGLKNAIIYCIKNKNNLKTTGRKDYENGLDEFEKRMNKFCDKLKDHNDHFINNHHDDKDI